ncbi:trimethyltridecatetraene synthase-like, partial [Lycium ferocissimum]|uniref:trimethyltridecatetraene synthase-like n=1 Tax=Lycium ferocissimum TaxID=112874 RepID=UPI0028168B93
TLNPKSLDPFKYIRVEDRRKLISRLYVLSGKLIFLNGHLPKFRFFTISRMVMSGKYHRDESKSNDTIAPTEKLQWMLDEWFILGGMINIGDWISWLNWLDLQGYIQRMKALEKKLIEFFNYELEDHKAKAKEDSVTKDMVDVLLQLVDDPNLEVKLTTDNLMGLILSIRLVLLPSLVTDCCLQQLHRVF